MLSNFILILLFLINPLLAVIGGVLFSVMILRVIDDNFTSLYKNIINLPQSKEYTSDQPVSIKSNVVSVIDPHNPFEITQSNSQKAPITQSTVYQGDMASIKSLFIIIIITVIITAILLQYQVL